MGNYGNSTLPSPPTGWSLAEQVSNPGGLVCASIFYKIAAGGDTAPTCPGNGQLTAALAEFSGNVRTSPVDQVGNTLGNSNSGGTMTMGGNEAQLGELIIPVVIDSRANNILPTVTQALNNATYIGSTNSHNSNAVVNNYGYAIGTANSSATTSTISISGVPTANFWAAAMASFKPLASQGNMFLVL